MCQLSVAAYLHVSFVSFGGKPNVLVKCRSHRPRCGRSDKMCCVLLVVALRNVVWRYGQGLCGLCGKTSKSHKLDSAKYLVMVGCVELASPRRLFRNRSVELCIIHDLAWCIGATFCDELKPKVMLGRRCGR